MACERPNRPCNVRLQKYLASCGLGSRRSCEKLIADGVVCVDGDRITTQGVSVDPKTNVVTVNGRPVRPDPLCYLALNKPAGYICTGHDPEGRETFHELLPCTCPRVFSVGRLDQYSEGLLLVTNDGDWGHKLLHPRHQVLRTYHVWTKRPLTPDELRRIRQGVLCDGERLAVHAVHPLPARRHEGCYEMTLNEGRNRHIRRMLDVLGVGVARLCRTQIGPLKLGALKPGSCRALTPAEMRALEASASAD